MNWQPWPNARRATRWLAHHGVYWLYVRKAQTDTGRWMWEYEVEETIEDTEETSLFSRIGSGFVDTADAAKAAAEEYVKVVTQ